MDYVSFCHRDRRSRRFGMRHGNLAALLRALFTHIGLHCKFAFTAGITLRFFRTGLDHFKEQEAGREDLMEERHLTVCNISSIHERKMRLRFIIERQAMMLVLRCIRITVDTRQSCRSARQSPNKHLHPQPMSKQYQTRLFIPCDRSFLSVSLFSAVLHPL